MVSALSRMPSTTMNSLSPRRQPYSIQQRLLPVLVHQCLYINAAEGALHRYLEYLTAPVDYRYFTHKMNQRSGYACNVRLLLLSRPVVFPRFLTGTDTISFIALCKYQHLYVLIS
jgi:hypothetical protein